MVFHRDPVLPDFTISSFIVWQKGKRFKKINFLYSIFAAISIYSMILPTVLLDIFLWQYQRIYFALLGIPKIKRNKYVIIDRYHLNGLSIFQRFDCIYCGYVNGVVAFAKEVANQTEIYSCAIKHRLKGEGQEHQKNFYSHQEFASKKNSE